MCVDTLKLYFMELGHKKENDEIYAGNKRKNTREDLLKEIDKTVLDDRRIRWREAIKNATYTMLTDRQKYATEAWKETEGEDLELRRAKMVQKIAENVEIGLLDFDGIVGRIGNGDVNSVLVENCYTTAVIELRGRENKGGVTATNAEGSIVRNCYFTEASAVDAVWPAQDKGTTVGCRQLTEEEMLQDDCLPHVHILKA